MSIDHLKVTCLLWYLDHLPLDGIPLGERIRIGFHVSCEINRAIEKRGLTDGEQIVAAVRRRTHSYLIQDIETVQRGLSETSTSGDAVEVGHG